MGKSQHVVIPILFSSQGSIYSLEEELSAELNGGGRQKLSQAHLISDA